MFSPFLLLTSKVLLISDRLLLDISIVVFANLIVLQSISVRALSTPVASEPNLKLIGKCTLASFFFYPNRPWTGTLSHLYGLTTFYRRGGRGINITHAPLKKSREISTSVGGC